MFIQDQMCQHYKLLLQFCYCLFNKGKESSEKFIDRVSDTMAWLNI